MYKIAICDDSPADTLYLQGLVSKWARKADEVVEVQTFASAEAFLFQYEEDKSFDILLLDIEMAEMDGVSLATCLIMPSRRTCLCRRTSA